MIDESTKNTLKTIAAMNPKFVCVVDFPEGKKTIIQVKDQQDKFHHFPVFHSSPSLYIKYLAELGVNATWGLATS